MKIKNLKTKHFLLNNKKDIRIYDTSLLKSFETIKNVKRL